MQQSKEYINETLIVVCDYFKINIEQLLSRDCMTKDVYSARQFAWYILHTKHCVSVTQIALKFNKKRRAIFHGVAKIRDGIVLQSYYRNKLADLYELLERERED